MVERSGSKNRKLSCYMFNGAHKAERTDCKREGLEALKARPSDILHLVTSPDFPKRHHQLGNNYTNAWAYGKQFSFRPPRFLPWLP